MSIKAKLKNKDRQTNIGKLTEFLHIEYIAKYFFEI